MGRTPRYSESAVHRQVASNHSAVFSESSFGAYLLEREGERRLLDRGSNRWGPVGAKPARYYEADEMA
jgi:hypothetical protein